MEFDPQKWARFAYFTNTRCHLQVNNMYEAFDKTILGYKEKPIIHLVKDIRLSLIDKIIIKN